MLISCPTCNAVYTINAEQFPEKGKKFKCAECGKIWTVMPDDLFDIEPEKQKITPEQTEISQPLAENNPPENEPSETENSSLKTTENEDENVRKMFEMLSHDTKGLFNDGASNNKIKKAVRYFKGHFSIVTINFILSIIFFIFLLFILYFNRYDVVNIIPRTEKIYDKIGLESVYYGRDLKFTNVETKHITRKGKHFIEVFGRINNEGKYKSLLPPVKATVYTPSGEVVNEESKKFTIPVLESGFNSIFRILIENINDKAEYLELDFIPKGEYVEKTDEKETEKTK